MDGDAFQHHPIKDLPWTNWSEIIAITSSHHRFNQEVGLLCVQMCGNASKLNVVHQITWQGNLRLKSQEHKPTDQLFPGTHQTLFAAAEKEPNSNWISINQASHHQWFVHAAVWTSKDWWNMMKTIQVAPCGNLSLWSQGYMVKPWKTLKNTEKTNLLLEPILWFLSKHRSLCELSARWGCGWDHCPSSC